MRQKRICRLGGVCSTNIIKKDGTLEEYNEQKIIDACNKAARRAMVELSDQDYEVICNAVWEKLVENDLEDTEIYDMHNIVEAVLEEHYPIVGKMYKEYRNYKKDFIHMMDKVYEKSQTIRYIGDKSNANTDSALVATKRSLIYNELSSELYKKFFLTADEKQAMKDGYIYIHDRSARLDTFNCFRRDTKFITKNGIKSFYDFNDGDETVVLSHKGIWRKATVHKYGWQPIQKVTLKKKTPTSKEMYVYCTKDHRWFLNNGEETTNLSVGDDLYSIPDRTHFDWDALSIENKKLWCKGFAKGDGALTDDIKRPRYVYIRLCGEKNKYADRFRDSGYSVTTPKSYNGDHLVSMLSEPTKDIPWLDLDFNNVLYYINGFMCADGCRTTLKNANSEYRGVQVTGDFNDYIYDLLNMSGYYVSSTRDMTGTETNYGKRTDKTIYYTLSSSQLGNSVWTVTDISPEKLNSKAEVWCLDVEVDHGFILEGGIPTGNCCLCRIGHIMRGGFEMGNVWYNEPNSLDTAFDVMGDIILSTAAQQYGGFTVPEVDKILGYYAEKSYNKYIQEHYEVLKAAKICFSDLNKKEWNIQADQYAIKKLQRDFEQGWQGIEYKLNTVGSSRGDYPFITMTIGLATDRFGKMAAITLLNVHKEGQGKKGFKRPVLFPKIVFLYDKDLHGDGSSEYTNADVFNAGIECSSKTMYPDWLSLTGHGYVPEMYKKYGKVVSPMGCRAFLSPWYEKGGMYPDGEDDKPVFEGRCNLGVVSLNLPMILAKSNQESKDFYVVLDYYLELIRNLHKRTIDYIGELRASVNPVMFCEGGLLGGNLQPDEKIKSILAPMTISYGITALNELQRLYNGKSIREDGHFALEVMQYIQTYIERIKKEDHILYAVYGTPAESLCGLQVEQFRKIYGIVENVSDRPYVSNSFHCHVSEDMSPIEKQDKEERFWNYFNGGKIQYCRYNLGYNKEAIKTLVLRAMDKGFYEGVNLAMCYCEDCGYQQVDMDVCPKCGSKLITKIDRMNGYLGFTRVHGETRYNASKVAEINDRVSM